jgi:CPA2 family monovalent cation:H+ antiporter-2
MLISETEYKHQVEEDIKPFRDVLLGLFFITIGMLLNVQLVLQLVAGAGAAVRPRAAQVRPDRRAGQAVRLLRRRVDAHRPGAGAGGRIRLRAAEPGRRHKLMDPFVVQVVLASMVLSMLLAPFIIASPTRS